MERKDNAVDADMGASSVRVKFIAAWCALLLVKLWLAFSLPAFGDEAFYALEGRELAWAYSDLPGLTAWLAALGTWMGGHSPFSVRLPFLLLGASLPWLVVRIASFWLGPKAGWQAGLLSLLMPLSGLAGVLALPDVPMLLAALLCLDALSRLLVRVTPVALVQLGLALAMGALSHYRFALVVLAGGVGLLCVPQGRALLRRPGLWLALAFGALAWWPLLAWNLEHGAAGLSFQFVDRHPWALQADGLWWPLVQAVLVTPALFVLLVATWAHAIRERGREDAPHWPLLAGLGSVAVGGFFLMAFFADSDRVSFHWPLAGWIALICAAPAILARWRPAARVAVHAFAAAGLALAVAYLAVLAQPAGRAWLASGPAYADNFSGWNEVASAVKAELAQMPPETQLVADNFMLGAQLSLALDRPRIPVLEHPLNQKHGRALQLAQWGLLTPGRAAWGSGPVLLVVEDTARPLKTRLQAYRELCARTGGLPPAKVLNVDHGRKRFLLFRLPGGPQPCTTPSLAWIDTPSPGESAQGRIGVSGWALRESSGIAQVDITLDGQPVVAAQLGSVRPDVLVYWGVSDAAAGSGFRAELDLAGRPPGQVWLGLVLHGKDGSVEKWPAQPLRIE
jgi:4-amino-4-deoxy-L-arabinose transferase-like glycosyltransferase